MNLILFDDSRRNHLLPLTFTRPVADLRIGILTIREKWEKLSSWSASFITEDYLSGKFPVTRDSENVLIAGSVLPDAELFEVLRSLGKNEALISNGQLLAARDSEDSLSTNIQTYKAIEYTRPFAQVRDLWDIFMMNGAAIEWDFELLTKGRTSAKPDDTNRVLGNRLFMEESAKASCSILNSTTGPIYLGKNSEVWEGSIIRGGFALCEESSVKLGAKIYGPTTVGPHSRVGGEISNSVIQGYSNKGHDGFLGNSVLGEWCNIGADSNNSNLKNNYANVKLWNYAEQQYVNTGLQFCGLIMGDHSKCGINTMFNTGTVVGVSANIFGAGFPPTFIPSFTWGGIQEQSVYDPAKAAETASLVFARRHKSFDQTEQSVFLRVFELTRQGG